MSRGKKWFRAKNYGWGWYPVTWQGYLVVAVFVGLEMLVLAEAAEGMGWTGEAVLKAIVPGTVVGVVLMLVCYRTGERPEWRWGGKVIGGKKRG